MDPLITAAELARRLGVVRILDVRYPSGRDRHEGGHLPGAVFVDLNGDLSDPEPSPDRGGRHPLPPVGVFAERMGRWGIGPDTDVVVHDDATCALAAARAWWMLRAAGHTRVRVLDGGMKAAVAAGLPITTETTRVEPLGPYPADRWRLPTVTLEQVDALRAAPDSILVDVRAAVRYRGEEEAFDPVAGHIEGAVNLPYEESLEADGRFLPAEVLRRRFDALLGDVPVDRLAVSCGSGVTACHTLLGLERAGLSGASLYVGSWSEWCRRRPDAIGRG